MKIPLCPPPPMCLQISGYILAYLLQLYLFYPTVTFVPFNRIYDVALFMCIHAISVSVRDICIDSDIDLPSLKRSC